MRWTEQVPALPLRSMAELAADPELASPLESLGPARGLLVLLRPDAADTVRRHLGSYPVERGGLLLGEVYADRDDPSSSRAVRVTQAVPAQDFDGTGVSLRMSSSVWEQTRRRRGPLELVVGWYHSHPGLGAFFSDTDRRTQRTFFPHAYSVGWVLDPLRGESAVFVGRRSEAPARVIHGVRQGAVDGGPSGLSVSGRGGGPTTSTRFTK